MAESAPTKIACPSCGADLAVPLHGRILKCDYCGSQSTLPNASPAPGGGPGVGATVVLVPEGRRWGGDHRLAVLIGTGISVLLMVSLFAWLLSQASERSRKWSSPHEFAPGSGHLPGAGGLTQPRGRAVLLSPSPLVFDVDGDGVEEVIALGRAASSQGGALGVVALDGKTFKARWRGDALQGGAGEAQPRLFRDAGTVLVSAASALVALRATSGEWRWGAALPDRAERIERRGDTLLVTAINGQEVALHAESGAVVARGGAPDDDGDEQDEAPLLSADGEARPPGSFALLDLSMSSFEGLRVSLSYCPPGRLMRLPVSKPNQGAGRSGGASRGRYELHGSEIVRRGSASSRLGRRLPSSSRGSRVRCDADEGLAFATQSRGSPVGFLVGYDREDGAEKWRLRLPPPDSLARMHGAPLVAIQGSAVIAGFVHDHKTLMLRFVDLESGRERWNVRLPLTGGRRLLGLGLGRSRAVAHMGDRFVVLDGRSGKVSWEGQTP